MVQQGNFAGIGVIKKRKLAYAKELCDESERVHKLINVVLANGAYSVKEESLQLGKLSKTMDLKIANNDIDALNTLEREKDLVRRTYAYRRLLASRAMDLLEEILIEEGIPISQKRQKRGDTDIKKEVQTVKESNDNQ